MLIIVNNEYNLKKRNIVYQICQIHHNIQAELWPNETLAVSAFKNVPKYTFWEVSALWCHVGQQRYLSQVSDTESSQMFVSHPETNLTVQTCERYHTASVVPFS